MNLRIGLAALLPLLLSACAMHRHDPAQHLGDRLHQRPLITVKAGIVSVSPEPVVFQRSQSKGEIVWRLPAGYSFPDNGIEIKGLLVNKDRLAVKPDQYALMAPGLDVDASGKRAFDCQVNKTDQQEFKCEAAAAGYRIGVYRYMIRVVDDSTKRRIEWDPNIFAID